MADQNIALAHHFADVQQQREAATLGMWIFLTTEVLLFGGLFCGYTVYRSVYGQSFEEGSSHLDWKLGAINTAILIGSSLMMALAHHAAVLSHRKQISLFLALTVLLGSVFLGIKFYEYYHKYEEHLVPGIRFDYEHAMMKKHQKHGSSEAAQQQHAQGARLSSSDQVHGRETDSPGPLPYGPQRIYFSFYFLMTGLHAAHMIAGIFVLLVLACMAPFSRLSTVVPVVEVGGLYWHFVDIVWIFLFPLLYLIGI